MSFLYPKSDADRRITMPEKTTESGRKPARKPKPEVVEQIPLSELHPFPDHPFQVRDDDAAKTPPASGIRKRISWRRCSIPFPPSTTTTPCWSIMIFTAARITTMVSSFVAEWNDQRNGFRSERKTSSEVFRRFGDSKSGQFLADRSCSILIIFPACDRGT